MAENEKYKGFTLSLALVDAIPVLFFGGSSILIGMLFKSPLFMTGACLCFLAGFLKVMWKVILATSGKDIPFLNKQLRVIMPLGFFIIILSVIIGAKRISFPAIWAGITSLPSLIFFIIGICGMITMGVLAKKLDSTKVKSNWIEQCVNGVAQICIFLGLLFLL